MTKNQTPETFAAKIAATDSDTTQVRLLMKAEAVLSSEDYAKLLELIKGL
jgi:hypothetical protein